MQANIWNFSQEKCIDRNSQLLMKLTNMGFQWQGSRWWSQNSSNRDSEQGHWQSFFTCILYKKWANSPVKNVGKVANLWIRLRNWEFLPISRFQAPIWRVFFLRYHRDSHYRKPLSGKFYHQDRRVPICALPYQFRKFTVRRRQIFENFQRKPVCFLKR